MKMKKCHYLPCFINFDNLEVKCWNILKLVWASLKGFMKAVVRRYLCIRVVGLQSSNLLTYHKESDIVSISISLRSLVKLVNDAFSEPINSQTAFLCKKLNAYFHLKTLQIMSLKTKVSNSFNPSKHFLFSKTSSA